MDLEQQRLLATAVVCVGTGIYYIHRKRKSQNKRKRKSPCEWVKSYLLRRPQFGLYEHLIHELASDYIGDYKNFMRMDPHTFHKILAGVAPLIHRQNTPMRDGIPADQRLCLTIRFLATGDLYPSMQWAFLIGRSTISKMVKETCQAISTVFLKEQINVPSTSEGWLKIAEDFSNRWQFHHTLGCIDGKHIAIRSPPNAGSRFHNYKNFDSIILLAVVDANYKFRYIDVGAEGAAGDAGVFRDCSFKQAIDDNIFDLPPDKPLDNDPIGRPVPYFWVGDDAFAMKTWLMKPYPFRQISYESRIFNYRLSRARRIVESAFGILSSRFRCLSKIILTYPDTTGDIVIACCILHNMLTDSNPNLKSIFPKLTVNFGNHEELQESCPYGKQFASLQSNRSHNPINDAKVVRDYLRDYYNSPAGAVPWQEKAVLGKILVYLS